MNRGFTCILCEFLNKYPWFLTKEREPSLSPFHFHRLQDVANSEDQELIVSLTSGGSDRYAGRDLQKPPIPDAC